MASLQGQLLVSSPKLLDPNFVQTVLLIVQHDENGAMGLVLNRPTQTMMAQAWQQVSESPCLIEAPLYQGGPCEGPLMVLHTDAEQSQIEVMDGVHFATEAEKVTALVEAAASPTKFFVGYAGWTAGQLEAELLETAWLVTPATAEDIFETPEWETVARRATRKLQYPLVNPKLMPPDPSVN